MADYIKSKQNKRRAATGRKMLAVRAATDFGSFDPHKPLARQLGDEKHAVCVDTLTDLFHAIAQLLSVDDLADCIRIASDHFETEANGKE